jgi:hypothetical protein
MNYKCPYCEKDIGVGDLQQPTGIADSDYPTLTVIFPPRRSLREVRITAPFTRVGDNLYRLDEGFPFGPISFRDVIEALPSDKQDVVLFQRRVVRAGLKRGCFFIPHDIVHKPDFAELMDKIAASGGFSAVDFGGVFLVLLPRTSHLSHLDVSMEISKIRTPKWKRRYHDLKSGLKGRVQGWRHRTRWLNK